MEPRSGWNTTVFKLKKISQLNQWNMHHNKIIISLQIFKDIKYFIIDKLLIITDRHSRKFIRNLKDDIKLRRK